MNPGTACRAAARVVAFVALALVGSLACAGVADASPAPVATPRLAAELRRLSAELAPPPAPPTPPAANPNESSERAACAVPATLDARELRRRLATAQRELVASGGSDRWLDPFFQRQDECKDDEARAALAVEAAGALALIAGEVEAALASASAEPAVRGERAARDAAAREALARVLAEDEFRRFPRNVLEPSDFQRWLLRLLDWWHRWKAPRGSSSLRWLEWLSDWMLTLGFAALVGLAVWMVLGRWRRERARAVASAARFAAPDGLPRAPSALEEHLTTLLAAGAHRDALRVLHLATLARLHELRRVPDAPGLTHWELLGALRAARAPAPALEHFATLNGSFDAAWYGHEPVDAARFEGFRETTRTFLDEVRSSAPRGSSTPAR
ncbi:MAG: DUF4129 domain-containing protein [Deltaproteobacteria bacterium]|nr:DUF4129 domain-containing protein [Deltaproteobacteria bacterium]